MRADTPLPIGSSLAALRAPYFLLLGVAFLARALVFLRPIADLDGLTIPDDCFYTLNLARSIARGLGPYTGLAHTNGFQPLFGFLMVPSFWFFHEPIGPVRVAIIVSAVADTAALALFGRMLLQHVNDSRAVWISMLIWALSPYAVSNATNGLETSLAVFLVLAAASYFPKLSLVRSGAREFFVFGLLGGLALFARVDAGFLLAAAALLSARSVFARGIGAALKWGAATAAGAFLVNLPWWLFSYHYTGRIYPDSGRAVREISHFGIPWSFSGVFLHDLGHGVRTIVNYQMPTLVLLAAALSLLCLRSGVAGVRRWASTLWQTQKLLLTFGCALFCAYTTYIYGFWFYYRYFYVISIVVLFATGFAIDYALPTLDDTRRRWQVAGLAALPIVVMMARREPDRIDITGGPRSYGGIYFTADASHRAWMNMGQWAEDHFPAGTAIGARCSGAIGYFAEHLTVINLDGVVNHDAYEATVARRLLDYARSVHVRHILAWDETDFLRAATASYRDGDLALESSLEFESLGKPWYVYALANR